MQRLREFRELMPLEYSLTESRGSDVLYLRGKYQQSDQKNENGRVYPRSLWENVLASEGVKKRIAKRGMFGELEHPSDGTTKFPRVSHIVTGIHIGNDGAILGVSEILPTPNGEILRVLAQRNTLIGVSSRGRGISEMRNGVEVVSDNFELDTFDFVCSPSTLGAYATPAFESLSQYHPLDNVLDSLIQVASGVAQVSGKKYVQKSKQEKERVKNILKESEKKLLEFRKQDASLSRICDSIYKMIQEARITMADEKEDMVSVGVVSKLLKGMTEQGVPNDAVSPNDQSDNEEVSQKLPGDLKDEDDDLEDSEDDLEDSDLEDSEDDKLKNDLGESEDDLEDSEDDLEDSEDDLEDSEDDLEDSEDDLEDSDLEDSEDDKLKNDLGDSEDDLEDSEDDLEDSEDDLEDSEDDLEDSEDDLEDSEDDLEDSEDDLEGSEEQIESLSHSKSIRQYKNLLQYAEALYLKCNALKKSNRILSSRYESALGLVGNIVRKAEEIQRNKIIESAIQRNPELESIRPLLEKETNVKAVQKCLKMQEKILRQTQQPILESLPNEKQGNGMALEDITRGKEFQSQEIKILNNIQKHLGWK
jgi:hypothetical protein